MLSENAYRNSSTVVCSDQDLRIKFTWVPAVEKGSKYQQQVTKFIWQSREAKSSDGHQARLTAYCSLSDASMYTEYEWWLDDSI